MTFIFLQNQTYFPKYKSTYTFLKTISFVKSNRIFKKILEFVKGKNYAFNYLTIVQNLRAFKQYVYIFFPLLLPVTQNCDCLYMELLLRVRYADITNYGYKYIHWSLGLSYHRVYLNSVQSFCFHHFCLIS